MNMDGRMTVPSNQGSNNPASRGASVPNDQGNLLMNYNPGAPEGTDLELSVQAPTSEDSVSIEIIEPVLAPILMLI